MGHKILIVDDEPAIILMLKNRLEAEQYQVVTAADGAERLGEIQGRKTGPRYYRRHDAWLIRL